MKKMMNSSLVRVLRQVIQIGQFYHVAGWVVLFHNVGMDYQRSSLYENAWLHHIWWIFIT